MRVTKVKLEDVRVGGRTRQLKKSRLAKLTDSVREIGLQSPITVWKYGGDQYGLVAGLHRLEAARLGWDKIEAVVTTADEIDRQLWQVDENLIRAELTTAERASHVAKRKKLFEQRAAMESSNNGTTRPENRRRGRPKSFALETAEQTGRTKRDVNRDILRADRITPDVLEKLESPEKGTILAKIAATGTELDALARLDHQEQREVIREIEQGERCSVQMGGKPNGRGKLEELKGCWRAASDDERRQFVAWVRHECPGTLERPAPDPVAVPPIRRRTRSRPAELATSDA